MTRQSRNSVRRALALAIVLVATAVPAFAQDETRQAPVAPLSPSEQVVDQIQEQSEAVITGRQFSYDPGGRRDPFEPLVKKDVEATGKRPKGIAGMLVNEIALKGLAVDSREVPVALFQGSDNRGYTLRVGDIVYDAKVIDIDACQGMVMFRQQVNDSRRIKPYRDVMKRLNPTGEERRCSWRLVEFAPAPAPYPLAVEVEELQAIPRERFRTWSLFLVTNQEWLVPANTRRLQELYDRYQAFGRTIGANHAAVWFWKKDQHLDSPALASNVDVERAIAFCEALKLKPGDGPYLLFTAVQPDERVVPDAFHVFALGGKTAEDIGRLLRTLGDQLVMEGVVRGGRVAAEPGSDDFWSAWFDATRHALARLGMKVRFLIQAPSFTIDGGVKPGGEG